MTTKEFINNIRNTRYELGGKGGAFKAVNANTVEFNTGSYSEQWEPATKCLLNRAKAAAKAYTRAVNGYQVTYTFTV